MNFEERKPVWQPQRRAWASGGRGSVPPFFLTSRSPTLLDSCERGKTGELQSGTKVLGTVLQYSYFSVISRFPLKTVHPFRNFLAVLPPPTLYKVETRKKILDTYIQHCLWGEGRVWTCVNWKTPQKCKSVPRLLSMIVALGTRRTTNNKPSQSVIVFFCSTNHQFLSPLHKFCCKSFTPSSQLFGNIRWLQK